MRIYLRAGQTAQATMESLLDRATQAGRAAPRMRIVRIGVLYLAALALLLWANRQLMHRLPLTGDEPWYILQALGLVRLHSANLAPLIANHALFDPLIRHWDDHTADFLGNGERVLPNLPGYAAAIAPWYMLAGRNGVIAFQAVVAAVSAVLVYIEARRQFQSAVVAVFALLAFLLALPPLFYVGQLFPSTLASGVAFGGFVLASRVLPAASTRGRLLTAAATGILAGMLPWLHFKYALAAVALAAVAALAVRLPLRVWRPLDRRGREAWSAIGVIAGVLAVSFAGIVLYCHHYFGTWTPRISAGGGEADLGHPDLPRALNLLCDMFLDPQSGLLPWVPLALLIPAGLVLLWRRDRRFAGMLLIMLGGFLGAFAPVLITRDIYQGYALPSRFTVECAPYFALSVAAVLAVVLPEPDVPVRQPTPQWRTPRHVSWRDVARVARLGLALGCLGLLLAGAAFDSAALQAPQLLYHSTAGPRLVEEYPDMLPAWWFGIFPSTQRGWRVPGNYVTAATDQLIPDATLHQLRLADVEVPEGRYVATVTLACTAGGPEQVPVTLRTEGNLTGGVQVLGEQPMAVNCMARQPATVTLAFSSNGYQSLNFVVALPPGAPAVQASLTYRRVSSRH